MPEQRAQQSHRHRLVRRRHTDGTIVSDSGCHDGLTAFFPEASLVELCAVGYLREGRRQVALDRRLAADRGVHESVLRADGALRQRLPIPAIPVDTRRAFRGGAGQRGLGFICDHEDQDPRSELP